MPVPPQSIVSTIPLCRISSTNDKTTSSVCIIGSQANSIRDFLASLIWFTNHVWNNYSPIAK